MLRDATIFLLASVLVVPLVRRVGVHAVIGYLIAGLVIGPHGLALIGEVEGTHRLAELGVVFMLFAIGLELSLDRLKVMARYVFGLGLAQVAVTGLAIGAGALLLDRGWSQAAVVGGALALSSTAFVLQMLAERGELSTQLGRVVLSILLLQDLAVVPGLAVVTALGQEPEAVGQALILAAAKATAALALLLAAGRLVLRPLYRFIASTRSPELFMAATLLVVLATAWGTAAAGLSMSLGAFLAGLMLAGTEYRHQVEADIRPVRGILLGLFFISVGMLVDLRVIVPQFHLILAATIALLFVKALLIAGLGRLFGLSPGLAVNAGLHLAQGGEFAFVLFSLAMGTAVLPVETGQFLLAVVALSMAATPALAWAGRHAQRWLDSRGLDGRAALEAEAKSYFDHVVIAGFGRVGQTIAQLLGERGHRWIAVDLDVARVEASRAKGLHVFFGDACREAITKAARAQEARAVVITLDDPAAARVVLRNLRRNLPDTPIIVRARDHVEMQALLAEGATRVLPETTESSLLLGKAVLDALGEEEAQIQQAIEAVRQVMQAPARARANPKSSQTGGTG
ncbi:monovalent cation:proton antiporter-2 (CPA2) family protein [Rhodoligotrophos defluvii]|uniref:monovalent cation:proton antiporter-2 (CPA2) family protein n=1 Tax=Rhodoligotrophos defluvii TaxID=2561934 RepID=UPI001485A212|nr:monovalent cation:proton antiporter-2 (CPA2) family protein [Rhodoligotrophos defluvii]